LNTQFILESVYIPGRQTKEWLKIKVANFTQGVIAGFMVDGEKEGNGFSSLIMRKKKVKDINTSARLEQALIKKLFIKS